MHATSKADWYPEEGFFSARMMAPRNELDEKTT